MAAGGDRLEIKSTAFQEGSEIPRQYTCEGRDVSPPLSWSRPPEGTRSQALIMDDPDAPMGVFTHWVLFNIPPGLTSLRENLPKAGSIPAVGMQGTNDFGRPGYGGPCPPGGRPHHYRFIIHALDATLSLAPGSSKEELVEAMAGHTLAMGHLVGTYER